jgi:hypothetical protein
VARLTEGRYIWDIQNYLGKGTGVKKNTEEYVSVKLYTWMNQFDPIELDSIESKEITLIANIGTLIDSLRLSID